MLQVAGMVCPDMKTIKELWVMSRLVVTYIHTKRCILMALPKLPKIAHRRAAQCAHCAAAPRALCYECQLNIDIYKCDLVYITSYMCAIKHVQVLCDIIHFDNCNMLQKVLQLI